MPRALRSVAMALLDVRPALMQRSMCGRSACACAAAFARLILACSGLPSLMPRALAAASAWRVRSPIMCRSCSAAAASTVLLTTEKIRALVDNIRGNKNRIIEGEVVKKGEDDG